MSDEQYDEPYEVRLDIFEGPMDLLVHLIKKNDVDIYDIPIAVITEQFLSYLEWLKALDIDFAGDFLVMAATLTKIKSRMLIPYHEGGEEDDENDPRNEITRPLLEYLQIKSAAEQLYERELLGEQTFTRKPGKTEFIGEGEQMIQVGLFELIDAFQRILENVSEETRVQFQMDRVSVKDRISELVDVIDEKGSVTFEELFASSVTKNDLIVTFLAILEMVKLGLIQVAQHVQTGIIRIFGI